MSMNRIGALIATASVAIVALALPVAAQGTTIPEAPPEETTTTDPPVEVPVPFENCDEAFAEGRSDIPESDPRYGPHLDSDNDGIGCEVPPADEPDEDDELPAPTPVPVTPNYTG